jgi:hypothetical protein
MTVDLLKTFLADCLMVNYVILVVWFVAFVFFHEPMYQLHHRWFSLSKERFDTIHYSAMALYKIIIICFNLTPLIVLSLMF